MKGKTSFFVIIISIFSFIIVGVLLENGHYIASMILLAFILSILISIEEVSFNRRHVETEADIEKIKDRLNRLEKDE